MLSVVGGSGVRDAHPGPRPPQSADVAVATAPIMPDRQERVKRRPGSGRGRVERRTTRTHGRGVREASHADAAVVPAIGRSSGRAGRARAIPAAWRPTAEVGWLIAALAG